MTVRANALYYASPQFRKLSDQQRDRIHAASLEILERTGLELGEPEAVDLLLRAGAERGDDGRVRLSSTLVEWAIATAPKRLTLCDRYGRRVMRLEGQNVFYGPGSDCPNVIDLRTGERRPGLLADVEEGSRLCDALPNVDFLMSQTVPSDVPQPLADRYQMRAMLNASTKPILAVTTSLGGCEDVVRMSEVVLGGAATLRRQPIFAFYINVAAPLRHDQESLQKLLFLAERGLPAIYCVVVLRGLNGPVTLAGALALANAGELAGLVIAQLKREGAPVILSGGTNDLTDMRSLGDVYAAPENRVLFMELGHRYGLPLFGLGGASDAKLPDQQAAAEAALSLLTETLCGSSLVHDVGYLNSGLTYSLEQLVMCDEFIGWVKRFMDGVRVEEEELALDVVDELGPGGNYLSHPHTARHFREDWQPALFDRQNYEGWLADGGSTLRERAQSRALRLLAEHQPEPLPADVQHALDAIVANPTRD